MNKKDIFAAISAASSPQVVEVPEWKTTINLRPLTAGEWLGVGSSSDTTEGRMCYLLAMSIVDDDGNPVFDTPELFDMPATQGPVLSRLVNLIHEMNAPDIEKK